MSVSKPSQSPIVYFPGCHFWAKVPLVCACGRRYMTWEGLRACEWRHAVRGDAHA